MPHGHVEHIVTFFPKHPLQNHILVHGEYKSNRNTNLFPVTVQKEDHPVEKQTTRNPYRHPNYKNHFDQRHGQNEHK